MSLRVAVFDSVTTLVAGWRSWKDPMAAGRYRVGRELYKKSFFTAGDKGGSDRGFGKKSRSADTEINQDAGRIVDRCRELVRNNANIDEALNKITNNVVRNGITPQARLRTSAGEFDEPTNARLEAFLKRWSKKRYVDPSGHDSLAAICRLVLRHMWVDGELFVRRIWSKDLFKKGVIPFHIEVLERDYLAREIHGQQKNGNIARHGIETNALGKPLAYHFYINHPGDDLLAASREVQRIDASDVLHIYERKRASQGRGLSWLAAVVMDIYTFADYLNIERNGARMAASVALYLKSIYPEAFGPEEPDTRRDSEIGMTDSASKTLEEFTSQKHLLTKLPQQTEIQMINHNRPGNQFPKYVETSQRTHANGTSLSYSSYSGDYTASSYSADRSSKLEERLGFRGQQYFLCEKLLESLWHWAMEGIWMGGLMPMPGYDKDPDRWWDSVEWDLPGWTWVDPLKDSKGASNDLAIGITTRKKLAAARGEDWDEIYAQAMIEEKKMAELRKLREENVNA